LGEDEKLLYGVIADTHGNLQALQVVLEELDAASVDQILCLGDIVGYGANPSECLRITRDRASAVVAGNHDWAVAGKFDTTYFNADARDSVEWTRRQLSGDEITYLRELPLVSRVGDVTLVHSSLYGPEEFGYVQTLYDAHLCFHQLETGIALIGHSHVPIVFVDGDPIRYCLPQEVHLSDNIHVIANVGSVGQPRDMDPRASYVIYDSEQKMLYLRRVAYDNTAAAEAILCAGLPVTNAHRLQLGR